MNGRNIMPRTKGLLERLKDGERVVCGEGYIFELERRGYLSHGHCVPLAVLDDPDVVRALYKEFVHAGSDVVLALTYFGSESQMELVGRANDFERLNRAALRMAREVADDTGSLMAGNICNTNLYKPGDEQASERIRRIFKEQIQWAVEEGADYIVAETISDYGEAKLALDCIKEYGKGLPAVVTIRPTLTGSTYDEVPIPEACKRLEEAGACVVGVNCARGPETMLPVVKEIRKLCKGPIACLPNAYRTSGEIVGVHQLVDAKTGERAWPRLIDPFFCSTRDIQEYGEELLTFDAQYVGLCCGNRAHFLRTLAETLGRTPPASRYGDKANIHFSQMSGDREWSANNYRQSMCGTPEAKGVGK